MIVATRTKGSPWIETAPSGPAFAPLDGDAEADVAVIGGGIVGITTALLLAEGGADVVLLEADRLAHGVSGHTTAKVSSQHGMIYATLRSRFGAGGARAYAQANEAALAWIAERVRRDTIDCDFRRRASYAYAGSATGRGAAEDEASAAIEAGLPATLVESAPLPYPTGAAVRFDEQAEFHVVKYLHALLAALRDAGGRIHEGSRAVEVDERRRSVVKTPGGRVSADRVIVATHYPFLDRSLAFARVHPQRSYALACRIAGAPPEGMFIGGSPLRSVRAAPLDGEGLLLVGGEGHRPGGGGDTEQRYRRLERFARAHWDVRSIEYRWSSQDNTTLDGVPYVGRIRPLSTRILMATGFAKWGMTGGTAAAQLLADLALGRDNPSEALFDPNRLTLRASAARLVKENAVTGMRFAGDRIRRPASIEHLQPGEADIVRLGDDVVAAFRDDGGTLTAVSPTCTHLGCRVAWNSAERSWDCPCHGSRFAVTGEVLQGPAVHRLERKPVD